MITQHLMQLGDDATASSAGSRASSTAAARSCIRHGEALDRAAESARTDIAVLLEDLPRAEQTARALAEQLRAVGSKSAAKAVATRPQVSELAERTRKPTS